MFAADGRGFLSTIWLRPFFVFFALISGVTMENEMDFGVLALVLAIIALLLSLRPSA